MNTDTNIRLDLYVAEKEGLSRVIAKDIIEAGHVTVNGKIITKSGFKLSKDSLCIIDYNKKIFVSRGGFKLQKAIEEFAINLKDAICLDIGAASGGFSDCMIQNGARKVYAIDVGSSQLKDSIKNNARIISMENTDIRNVTKDMIDPVGFAAIDLSFISLAKILHTLYALMEINSTAVLLIKPQFEAGPGVVGKSGIIKNKKIHYKILLKVYNYIVANNFFCLGLTLSPVLGGDGNKEFLIHIKKDSTSSGLSFKEFDELANAWINADLP